MPLTAEDITLKKFETVEDRYDQDDVDDYLDEVAATVRDLSAALAAANARVAELEAAPAVPAPVFAAPAPALSEPEAATGLLALAQKIHDDHVAAGRAEADAVVTDARQVADKLVTDARETADKLVTDARAEADKHLGDLAEQKGALEEKVTELRTFEADYRERLTGQLQALIAHVAGN